jgi:glycosyltransferase involved in cell wall biosynthesis
MPRRLAIYHPSGHTGLKSDPFGKDVANLELFRALVHYGGYEAVHVLTNQPIAASELATSLFEGLASPPITTGLVIDQHCPAGAGTLLRGQPGLSELAWMRRQAVGDRAYSLIGLLHSIAPPALREQIAGAAIAPVQDWDAQVCTSPAVRDAVVAMFDDWNDYLQHRFGGDRRPRPHLPVIPLGVDGPAFEALADRPQVRARFRSRLGLSESDVLVIWVGRLSFVEKAFPQPMFRAVEEAAVASGAKVHFAMAGWFPDSAAHRPRYEQAARAYAPSTPIHFLDGNDQELVGELWAAGDIFLSLVDNIQETFGLTPVEAMAAGLPVVVSEWDGYRFTVRDGIEGFLVPTLGGPQGPVGELLVARHAALLDGFQVYAGAIAQHTAVSVGRAAQALGELIRSPELRRRMGTAGRARVRDAFDWPVIVGQYNQLIDELRDVRAAGAQHPRISRANPIKGDPFVDFAGFASQRLTSATRLRLRAGAAASDLQRAADVDLDRAFAAWRGTSNEAGLVLERLADGGALSVQELLIDFPDDRHPAVQMSLVWLAKLGILDWLEDDLKIIRL